MLNQVILIGRLNDNLVLQKNKNGKEYAIFKIVCPRTYKNKDGIIEEDFIPIIAFDVIANNTSNYCKRGDIIGIKGRIEIQEEKMQVVAEKITFLSSTNKEKK